MRTHQNHAALVVCAALAAAGGCSEAASVAAAPPADAGRDVSGRDAVSFDAAPEETPAQDYPAKLSETGLYKDIMNGVLADDVMPFAVRYPLWSDGAEKQRWLRIPAGQTIDTSDMDHWTYPVGTKAWKEFTRDGTRVETRFLEKRADGWRFVAYRWKDGDATPLPLGEKNALGTEHDIPSQEDCQRCHLGEKDFLLGVGAIQLSAEPGSGAPGMLSTLAAKGLLSQPPTGEFAPPGEPAEREVLGYLHGNCGGCHNSVGIWASARTLRLQLRVADTDPTMTGAYRTTIGVESAHGVVHDTLYTIVAGKPDESQLLFRMQSRDGAWNMPPLGTEKADEVAVAKVRAWIAAMAP